MLGWNCSRLTAASRPLPEHHLGYHKCLYNPLMPSGYYMYHQFSNQHFYDLPTQCIYVFCVDLRTDSDYFPVQH